MNPDVEARLTKKIKRADFIIALCMLGLLILLIISFGGIIYITQRNSDIAREQARQNHKRTQEYVKCVAETLTVPLAQRSENALDNCTKAADDRTKDAETK